MTIAIKSKIAYIVIATALTSKRCRSFNKFVIIKIEIATFSVPIINSSYLTLKTQYRKILPVKVCDKNIIIPNLSINVV